MSEVLNNRAVIGIIGAAVGFLITGLVNFVLQWFQDSRRFKQQQQAQRDQWDQESKERQERWNREDEVMFRKERLIAYRDFKTEAEIALKDYSKFQDGERLSSLVGEIQLISQSSEVARMASKFLADGQEFEWALHDDRVRDRLMDQDFDDWRRQIESSLDTFDEEAQQDLGMDKVPSAENKRTLRRARDERFDEEMYGGY